MVEKRMDIQVDAFDEFLNNYPPEIQAISQTLRAQIKKAMPEGREILHVNQNHTAFSLSASVRDEIIYLVPMKGYVRLGFFWGGALPDPHRLLVGSGKRLRHVKIKTMQEANHPGIQGLIEAAGAEAAMRKK